MGWEEPGTMPSNTVVTCHIHLKLNRIKNLVFQLYQTFEVLSSHMWLVATLLNSTNIEHFHYH